MSIKIISRLTALLLTVLPFTLYAADSPRLYLNPALGWQSFDSKRDIDNKSLLEMGLEYRYGAHWATELRFNKTDTDHNNISGGIDAYQYAIDGLYYIPLENSKFEPFMVLGAGQGRFDDDIRGDEHETQFNAGAGLRFSLSNNVTIRAILRGVYGHEDSTLDSIFTVGLSYAFGAQNKYHAAPAELALVAVIDDDNDGVADNVDHCLNTPAGRAVDAKGCKIVLKRTEKIELTVNFALDSATVPDESLSELKHIAQFISKYAVTNIDIEGHTDSSGIANYNKSLSQRRADAVKKILVERYGVDAANLNAIGYGEEQLVADDNTAKGRRANRRVIAVFKAEIEE